MAPLQGSRLAAIGGMVFVVGSLVSAFIVSPPPSPDDPSAKFLSYYSDHRTVLLVQALIGAGAISPAFLYVAGLWNVLRRNEREGGVLGAAAVFSLVGALGVIAIATSWPGALAFLAEGNGLDENSARTLSLISTLLAIGIFALVAGANGFTGWRLLQGTELPRWLGWVGLVGAVLALLGMCSVAKSGIFEPFGFFTFLAFLTFLGYIAIISVLMWMRAKPAA
jgi:Domain of unknown function (DUF4386)